MGARQAVGDQVVLRLAGGHLAGGLDGLGEGGEPSGQVEALGAHLTDGDEGLDAFGDGQLRDVLEPGSRLRQFPAPHHLLHQRGR